MKQQHLRARNRKGENLTELPHLTITERTGFSIVDATSLSVNGLGKYNTVSDTESVTLCYDLENALENKELFDVISAWPTLPSNIRDAILLLVRQRFQ